MVSYNLFGVLRPSARIVFLLVSESTGKGASKGLLRTLFSSSISRKLVTSDVGSCFFPHFGVC